MIPIPHSRVIEQHRHRIQRDVQRCALSGKPLSYLTNRIAERITMGEIINALESKDPPQGILKQLALSYAPTGRPQLYDEQGCHVESMLIELKGRIREKPKQWIQSTRFMEESLSALDMVRLRGIYFANRKSITDIQQYLDKVPPKSPVVFFAGEHAVVSDISSQWRMVKRMYPNAQFMGGLRIGSGYDYYAQGAISSAAKYWGRLARLIQRISPQTVIVPSSATYVAMRELLRYFQCDFELLTIGQAIEKANISVSYDKPPAIYQATQLRNGRQGDVLVRLFPESHDIDSNQVQPTLEYAYGLDREHTTIYHNIIAQARKNSDCLVVDCSWTAHVLRMHCTRSNTIPIWSIASFFDKGELHE